MTITTPPFDPNRAHLNAIDDFPPYNVEPADERPLRDVLASGEILPDTELVITERATADNPSASTAPEPAATDNSSTSTTPEPAATDNPSASTTDAAEPAGEPHPLAFLDRQLAFHHVAQGESAGHPWMVSF